MAEDKEIRANAKTEGIRSPTPRKNRAKTEAELVREAPATYAPHKNAAAAVPKQARAVHKQKPPAVPAPARPEAAIPVEQLILHAKAAFGVEQYVARAALQRYGAALTKSAAAEIIFSFTHKEVK
jgi:hypothetical protein